jgi:uncharacterized membrane protein
MFTAKGQVDLNGVLSERVAYDTFEGRMVSYYDSNEIFEIYSYGVIHFAFVGNVVDTVPQIKIVRYNSETQIYEEFDRITPTRIKSIRKRMRESFLELEKVK